jgi:iron complex outermembrane recepter protein
MFILSTVNAQNKISGRITDQDNLPLTGATIYLPEINKGTISDKNGNYEVMNLPDGKIKIQFSFIGFIKQIETIQLTGNSYELNIILHPSILKADEIVVTGGYSSTQHENAVKIDVLEFDQYDIKSTPNFTEALTKIPGVDMISKGNGVSKPVIRGLSMNDILVLNNGVRFENYQYSDHHPLGIDEFGIEDVEIIKGPASLLYGSDAIGGVINFIKEKPAPINSIEGDYNLQLFSNSLGMTNNLGIKGASKNLFGGIRIGHKTNSDFLQGGGEFVPNSRFNEYSIKTNAGYTEEIGVFKLYFDFNKQNLGLVEDEAIEEITGRDRVNSIFYEQLNTYLISSQNKIYMNNYKLDINLAYQNTELIHFGEADFYEIQMELATITYETKIYLPSDEKSEYIIGFQGLNQINTNLNNRETKLLPDATTNNYSTFGLFQHKFFNKLRLQAGIRYDNKTIESKSIGSPDSSGYRIPLSKIYGNISGSLGATYNITETILLRTNIATAFRTPNLAELTSNGPHETRYESGDNKLIPEKSYEFDFSMHLHKENYTFDLACFYNIVNNFIFISPTGDTSLTGLNIYQYKQKNSILFGGEAGFHFHPNSMKWLHFETTFSSVTGKQQNGEYLPYIPANKLNLELRAVKDKMLFFNNSFIATNVNTAFNQNNFASEETATNGYTLMDLTIGTNINMNDNDLFVSLSITNIFDKKYIDHLSTLKEVNYFNPGRNITLTIRVPFKF